MKKLDRLREMLIRHEGYSNKPYADTEGKITIGIGRNLADKGLSTEEVIYLFENDIHEVVTQASEFVWFEDLGIPRQDVVISMIFNMGINRFKGFHKMIAAIEAKDFVTAAAEMLLSKWAQQVKGRALELSKIMETGQYEIR